MIFEGTIPAVAIVVFLFALNAFAVWSPPTAVPPANNIAPPLNKGLSSQYKDGSLGVGGKLHTYADVTFDTRLSIGTTTPPNSAQLSIVYPSSASSGTTFIIIDPEGDPSANANAWNIGVDTGGTLHFADSAGISSGTKMMIRKNTGVVGIGLAPSNDDYRLTVAGNINTNDALCIKGVCYPSWDDLLETLSADMFLPSGTINQTMRHNGTTWVASSLLSNTGTNVGIGTTNPQQALQLEQSSESIAMIFREPGTQQYIMGIDTRDDAKFKINRTGDFDTIISVPYWGGSLPVYDANRHRVSANALSIDKEGRVLIGDPSVGPIEKLTVAGDVELTNKVVYLGPEYTLADDGVANGLVTNAPNIEVSSGGVWKNILTVDEPMGCRLVPYQEVGTDLATAAPFSPCYDGSGNPTEDWVDPDDHSMGLKPNNKLGPDGNPLWNTKACCPFGYEALATSVAPEIAIRSDSMMDDPSYSAKTGYLVCCNIYDAPPVEPKMLVNNVHSELQCTMAGGVVDNTSSIDPADGKPNPFCKFSGTNCGDVYHPYSPGYSVMYEFCPSPTPAYTEYECSSYLTGCPAGWSAYPSPTNVWSRTIPFKCQGNYSCYCYDTVCHIGRPSTEYPHYESPCQGFARGVSEAAPFACTVPSASWDINNTQCTYNETGYPYYSKCGTVYTRTCTRTTGYSAIGCY